MAAEALEEDLQKELSFHLEQIQTELNSAGLPPQSAEEQSRRQIGNLTLAKEECRECGAL
jgi:hypothetical protein